MLTTFDVMQQAEWAGRIFYQARDRQTGQVVYLIAEPAQGALDPYRHPNLPPLELAAVEGQVRWLMGGLTEGETLEDLRSAGLLAEHEILSALLSVIDGLASLSLLHPPVVPSYIDPACVKRDELGDWILDYLALAQSPETRSTGAPPLGIYPFGVLLYWLATGQIARRTRIQVNRVSGISPALQFILIRCLGRAYPSLAELRSDVERAGREREFRSLVPARSPALAAAAPTPTRETAPAQPLADLPMELRRVTMGGPFIPADDRPWALPPRPPDGFRKFVVPPEPDPRLRRAARWGLAGVGAFVLLAITGAVMLRLGVFQPQPATAHQDPTSAPDRTPTPKGWDDDLLLPDKQAIRWRQPQPQPPDSATEPQPPDPQPPDQQPAGPKPPVTTPRPKPPAPRPPTQPPSPPSPPPPTPGTGDYADAHLGALPMQVHLDGRNLGYAYLFPSPHSPDISLETFNRLFDRTIYWAPHEGGQIRLLTGNGVVITADFTQVADRIWLKLTPALQDALGIQLQDYRAEGIYFTTLH